ncbi:MAG: hypothetical protein JXB25_00090 [Deltaproteobacteria bacterium]|nr:hypothetical protein [Deltaproteobacteria bacterium]
MIDWDCVRRHYREFALEELSEGHREEFHRGSFESRIPGDDRFDEQALLASGADA